MKDKTDMLQCEDLTEIINDTKTMLDFLTDNTSFSYAVMNFNYIPFDIGSANLLCAMKTLDNILFCCKNCSFSDANVLLRKYRDDIFQYLYFIKIINESRKYTFNVDNMPNILKKRIEAAHLWSKNELSKNPKHELKTYIRAVEYKDFLQSDKEIKRCCEQFFISTWEMIDANSNNYVHSNSKHSVLDNFLDSFQTRKRCVDEIAKNIKLVSVYFLSLLLLMESHLFVSTDYLDYLEFNEQPPEGSQYWIMPVFQDYFDKYVYELSPELLEHLRKNNSHGMIIN